MIIKNNINNKMKILFKKSTNELSNFKIIKKLKINK